MILEHQMHMNHLIEILQQLESKYYQIQLKLIRTSLKIIIE